MKILHVTNFFKPSWETGGVTRIAYEISKKLVEMGHDITVYTTDGFKSRLHVEKNKPVDVDGIRTYYFRNLSCYLTRRMVLPIPYYLPFVAKKEVKNFDVIHIHEHRTLLAVAVHYYAKKYNIPYVLQAHGSVLPFFQKNKMKRIFDFLFGYKILTDASKIIALNETEEKQYIQMGVEKNKIEIVSNGINISEYENLPDKGTFRKKFEISQKYIILFLGRLHKRKGIDFLIKSCAELKKEIDDVILVLVGSDDGFKVDAEILINQLNLINQVRFIGYVDNIDRLAAYTDADVVIYPSILEIFGLVPFEAIMCGTPIIVTDGCGCGELVKEANCGYLVTYGDVNILKNEIIRIIQHPSDAHELVKNGQKYVSDNFTLNNVTNTIKEIYENCIKKD